MNKSENPIDKILASENISKEDASSIHIGQNDGKRSILAHIEQYEAISPGMGNRVLKIIERDGQIELEKSRLTRQKNLMAMIVSVSLAVAAGTSTLTEAFWPVSLVLGLSGMATFVLYSIIEKSSN
ncbi:MAG: hypothetical protein OXE92_10450 [Bacteroidetes bacterium]|nr:hypothetical protein [Bacteroidota bacterium]